MRLFKLYFKAHGEPFIGLTWGSCIGASALAFKETNPRVELTKIEDVTDNERAEREEYRFTCDFKDLYK